MSKSLGKKHYIGLFESIDTVKSKVSVAVTESECSGNLEEMGSGVSNLLLILKACGKELEAMNFEEDYQNKKIQFKYLKDAVYLALSEIIQPKIEKKRSIENDGKLLFDQVYSNSLLFRKEAEDVLAEVKRLVGISY